MSINRREFLLSSAAFGAAAAAWSPLSHLPGWRPPTGSAGAVDLASATLVVVPSPAAEAFERGARAALRLAGLADDRTSMCTAVGFGSNDLPQSPSDGAGAAVIGLVPESDFILLNEWMREHGARLLYHATHVEGGEGRSRHTFSTTAASVGLGAALARWFEHHQHQALVQETALRPSRRPLPDAAPTATANAATWAEHLGHDAALVAAGRWRPRASAGIVRVGGGGTLPATSASYVSFVCVS